MAPDVAGGVAVCWPHPAIVKQAVNMNEERAIMVTTRPGKSL
jgi:hypothetical protein